MPHGHSLFVSKPFFEESVQCNRCDVYRCVWPDRYFVPVRVRVYLQCGDQTNSVVENNPPNRPPTGVFLVPKLKFFAKIFAVYSRSCGRPVGYEPGGRRFESCRAHHKIKRRNHLRRSVTGTTPRLDLLVFTQALEAESGTDDPLNFPAAGEIQGNFAQDSAVQAPTDSTKDSKQRD
jgi:hypothetical protein